MNNQKARGVLIAFEGIDGTGKTTQAGLLENWARDAGLLVLRTKEPTNGPWGQKIRASKIAGRLPAAEELEAFLKDRREHVEQEIEPALARGALVIIDRYYYSTVAYQGARGLDPNELLKTNRAFAPKPDLVVLLDIEPRAGLARVAERGSGHDTFETENELGKALAVFRSMNEPHILRLDARQSIAELHAAVVARSKPLVERLRAG